MVLALAAFLAMSGVASTSQVRPASGSPYRSMPTFSCTFAAVPGTLLYHLAATSLYTAAKHLLMLQDSSRKLLQIDDSATTVTAAPLSAANATANASSSLLAPPSEDSKPHSVLSDVISSFKSKYGKSPQTAPAAAATANATATVVVVSNDDNDVVLNDVHDALAFNISGNDTNSMMAINDAMEYYMEPCSDGPVPSAYDSFVQVCIQSHCLHQHLHLSYAHSPACKAWQHLCL